VTHISGGEIVARILLQAGVGTLFGINGAHVDTIYQAALDHGLPIVDTRHEMNAGHAAEGYARVRNSLGVAVLTAGGGFTNAVTSMANAHLDRTPVLYLAGSGPMALDQANTLQAGIDQVAIATPVTKWAHRVTRAELIPRILARAIRTALAGPRGPVLIDIPWDVLTAEIEEPDLAAELAGTVDATPSAPPAIVEEILSLLASAQRPVVLAGSEVARAGAGAELRAFAEAMSVPMLSDFEALGLLSGSPAGFGLVQSLSGLADSKRPDVVVMLGLRFGLATGHGSGTLIPHEAGVVQVDSDARELGHLQPVTKTVLADPGTVVRQLHRAAAARAKDCRPHHAPWWQHLRAHIARRQGMVAAQVVHDGRIHPYEAATAIANALPRGAIVVADGALTYLWLSETIPGAGVSAYLCHGYLGSMGVGMGVALGAQAAARDLPVVLVTGDGAVGYSLGEFDAMVRARLPVVVVVLNNRAWGATLHAQELVLGKDRIVNNRLENGSYSQVARALGADGALITELADLAPALARAISSQRPTCLDVQVSLDPIPPEERVIMGGTPF
jgi:acetolactate synthase I/II/III large subunit